MQIKLGDLLPNPFRDIDNYPIDREKVEALKDSISKTSFWDNILAREHHNKFQIAYGHHRLTALRELFDSEYIIDIPVKDLDDATMLRIMANENKDDWSASPAIVNETIRAVKDYLDDYVKNSESPGKVFNNQLELFADEKEYRAAKKSGVNGKVIKRFLGSSWSDWMVKESLRVINSIDSGEIKKEAVEDLESMKVAEEFVKASKKLKLTEDEQKELADTIKEKGIGKRDVGAEAFNIKTKSSPKPKPEKPLPDVSDQIRALTTACYELNNQIRNVRAIMQEEFILDPGIEFEAVQALHTTNKNITTFIENLKSKTHELENSL